MILAPAGEQIAIGGRKRHRRDPVFVSAQSSLRFAVGAPESHVAIRAGGWQQTAVLAEGGSPNGVLMPFQHRCFRSLFEIPELRQLFAAGRLERLDIPRA